MSSIQVSVQSTDTVSALPALYVDDLPSASSFQNQHTGVGASAALTLAVQAGKHALLGEPFPLRCLSCSCDGGAVQVSDPALFGLWTLSSRPSVGAGAVARADGPWQCVIRRV